MPNDTVVEQSIDLDALLNAQLETEHLTDRVPLDPPILVLGGPNDRIDLDKPRRYGEILRVNQQIAAVLARITFAPGREGSLVQVGTGWVDHYANLDVYVGPAGGFEVHGDIRAKYDALGGASGVLGFPVTDETATPDGVGRFNHFEHGSIYWTPRTGPMMINGPIRDKWASLGWERSWLGYPVADEYRLPGLGAQDHPTVAWSRFENGAIADNAHTLDVAHTVEIANPDLRSFLRSRIDGVVHSSRDDIGFHPQTDDLGTSGWGYGFWSSVTREVGIRLYGWRENPVISDTEFTLELKLRFLLSWNAAFTYPASVSLVAALTYIKVHASGPFSEQVANGVKDGVYGAFYRGGPDPTHSEVPNGAVFITAIDTGADQHGDGTINLIDVATSAQGGLLVTVPAGPIIPGGPYNGRQILAQQAVDALLGR